MSTDSFLLRLDPEVLGQVRKAAEAEGTSVSGFIRQSIELRLAQGCPARSASREDILREIASTAARLGEGYVLVPRAEALPPGSPDSWEQLMDQEGP